MFAALLKKNHPANDQAMILNHTIPDASCVEKITIFISHSWMVSPEPPLVDVVVCCNKKRFPGPRHEYFLEEDLGHVEGRDDED